MNRTPPRRSPRLQDSEVPQAMENNANKITADAARAVDNAANGHKMSEYFVPSATSFDINAVSAASPANTTAASISYVSAAYANSASATSHSPADTLAAIIDAAPSTYTNAAFGALTSAANIDAASSAYTHHAISSVAKKNSDATHSSASYNNASVATPSADFLAADSNNTLADNLGSYNFVINQQFKLFSAMQEQLNLLTSQVREMQSHLNESKLQNSTTHSVITPSLAEASANKNTANWAHEPNRQQPVVTFPDSISLPPVGIPIRKLHDLPEFQGTPEDWPLFYNTFIQSTNVYGYGNLENNQRLQKCLKGEAREVVKSLLIHPHNVTAVIEQLKFRFGRPELLIRSQLNQLKEISAIPERGIDKLVPYATKVRNFATFMQSVDGKQHLANPTLLEELVGKLPMSKRLDWAKYSMPLKPYPTIEDFATWLENLARLVCVVQAYENHPVVLHAVNELDVSSKENHAINTIKCRMCQGPHRIYDCDKFKQLPVADRWLAVKRNRLCFSCLNSGHVVFDCRRRVECEIQGCKRRHHKLLHEVHNEPLNNASGEAVLSCQADMTARNEVLFRVVPITLFGPRKNIDTYALLDDGLSITMMDESLACELGLQGNNHDVCLQWFENKTSKFTASIVSLHISGRGMQKRHKLINVHAIPNFKLPTQSINEHDLRGLPGACKDKLLCFSDAKPRILIGLDHCHLGIPSQVLPIGVSGPYAANTELGWLVFGPANSGLKTLACLFVNPSKEEHLQKIVEEYFAIDSFGVKSAPAILSKADLRTQQILQKTTLRVDGRFQTGLLWNKDIIELPDSYGMTEKRLSGVERKMKNDEAFASAYKYIISQYVAKGYARKLEASEAAIKNPRLWFLPHFGVVNINKPNKLRLVFDAAATVNGTSLNSNLLKGPQNYLATPSVLFNFRIGAVAVSGDIKEMFHQILIRPDDRVAQRFLWRGGDSSRPPDVYEMMAMTFGAACSPCIAHYVKATNALEHAELSPRAVESIIEHHYVDDFVDSFSTVNEAIEVAKAVRDIHAKARFELRGFISNSIMVGKELNGEDNVPITTRNLESQSASEKVLGTFWQPRDDTFIYQLNFNRVDKTVLTGERRPTKREFLSTVMSVFDPLGFLAHFMVAAKLLLREVWRLNISWDEPIPDEINNLWQKWRNALSGTASVKISRHYFVAGMPVEIQLHVFVDASEHAFAAVAYWRYVTTNGKVSVSLICGKTRCAPLKPMTVPRLELQAAVLGTRLMQTVVQEHKLNITDIILWSDSSTVLQWLRSEHCQYKPFVAHRVAEILANTSPENWRWLPTKENVADEATRWKCDFDPQPSSRWFAGPDFLYKYPEVWPKTNNNTAMPHGSDDELRKNLVLIAVSFCPFNMAKFTSYYRLNRTVAWVYRFINNCRKISREHQSYGLTASEVNDAEILLCRLAQHEVYASELQDLEAKRSLPKRSALYDLLPLIDARGILRVGGRIEKADWLPYAVKHPIIFPPSHALTLLIVNHFHQLMKHQNTEATIGEIRKSFWVPRLRNVLRRVITKCQECKIARSVPAPPLMGNLPEDRLTPYIRPFTYTGVDYFGPLTVTIGRRHEKRWIAVFTCLTVRAIHLEVAADLSTDAFILVLRNFINRRGVPLRIRSDNGKNFVGANEEAKRFSEVFDCERVQDEATTKGIEWNFNCPKNPSEGGIWERMVQCVKRVLAQTLKELAPREHTLQSFIIEAENIVNSRPLTHLPVTPTEEEPLTPNHFLLGYTNTLQASAVNEVHAKVYVFRKQWRIARQMCDHFWKRWILEYLPTLTRRAKWCERREKIKVGDLVFICDENMIRRSWCRGRVENIYIGKDGEIRRADVKTASGVLCRPVSRLAVLDVDCGESGSIHGGGGVKY